MSERITLAVLGLLALIVLAGCGVALVAGVDPMQLLRDIAIGLLGFLGGAAVNHTLNRAGTMIAGSIDTEGTKL